MGAYSEAYLGDVVENQGKLFDFVAQSYPDSDTEDFINTYMKSKTRKNIDDAMAYVNTMDAKELWKYFSDTEKYKLKQGKAIEGFMPDWIGEFYAYYQWYYNLSSADREALFRERSKSYLNWVDWKELVQRKLAVGM